MNSTRINTNMGYGPESGFDAETEMKKMMAKESLDLGAPSETNEYLEKLAQRPGNENIVEALRALDQDNLNELDRYISMKGSDFSRFSAADDRDKLIDLIQTFPNSTREEREQIANQIADMTT